METVVYNEARQRFTLPRGRFVRDIIDGNIWVVQSCSWIPETGQEVYNCVPQPGSYENERRMFFREELVPVRKVVTWVDEPNLTQ